VSLMVALLGGKKEQALPPFFGIRKQIVGVGSFGGSKRLGLQTRNMLVFQDASRLISRYHWERTKPMQRHNAPMPRQGVSYEHLHF